MSKPISSTNLSQEAQAYLAQAQPFQLPDSNPSEWVPFARNGFRAATQGVSDRAKAAYIEEAHEETIAGVPVLVATPKGYRERGLEDRHKVMIYIHGGGWTLGHPDHLYQNFAKVAHDVSLVTYAIIYPLAPESQNPAALDACVNVYEALLQKFHCKSILFLGDSAGANLCIATICKTRDMGMRLPGAVALLSPIVDMTPTSESHITQAACDPKLNFKGNIVQLIQAYAPDADLSDPSLSVIHSNFKRGFPPTCIIAGSREVLAGDASRLHEALQQADRVSSLHILEKLWHGVLEHGFPESDRVEPIVIKFAKSHIFREDADNDGMVTRLREDCEAGLEEGLLRDN